VVTAARKDPYGLDEAPVPTPRAPAPPPAPIPTPAPIDLGWDDGPDAALAPALDVSFDDPPAAPAPVEPIELPEADEEPELAPVHAFVPPVATTGHQPAPTALVPAPAPVPVPASAPAPAPGDASEAVLRDALSKASREVIERVVWEVVPQLAETIIRENLDRLVKSRQG
jgi:hypothetical protein